jgi:hypothetical protein
MFDFVSDRLLSRAGARDTILIPGARRMPVATLLQLRRLAEAGATVLFAGGLPDDVPGLGDLQQRRAQLGATVAALGPGQPGHGGRRWSLGRGRFVVAPDAGGALTAGRVRRERVVDLGLSVLRQRVAAGGDVYLLANLGGRPFEGWAPLATPAAAVVVMDPMSGGIGSAAVRAGSGGVEAWLALAPGETLLVRTLPQALPGGPPPWRWPAGSARAQPLNGPWHVRFLRGGPTLPGELRMETLAPWTDQADPALRDFSGIARHRTEFTLPGLAGQGVWLELPGVSAVATVRLNGEAAGTLWALPFRVDVTRHLRAGTNLLEIDVSSLPANRVAAQARAGVPRVRYHDIDFVDIRYRPFDPRGWPPLASGLTGPALLRKSSTDP